MHLGVSLYRMVTSLEVAFKSIIFCTTKVDVILIAKNFSCDSVG